MGCSSNSLDIHTCFPPRSASICINNCPRATYINQCWKLHPVNIDAYHWERCVHILVGGEGWHLCILPLHIYRAVLGPVSMFTASVAPCFALSAVLCEVTFNVTPITDHIGTRAAPGTTMGWARHQSSALLLLISNPSGSGLQCLVPVEVQLRRCQWTPWWKPVSWASPAHFTWIWPIQTTAWFCWHRRPHIRQPTWSWSLSCILRTHRQWTYLSAEPRSALSAFGHPPPFSYRGPVHHLPNTMVADLPHHQSAEVLPRLTFFSHTTSPSPENGFMISLLMRTFAMVILPKYLERRGWMVCLLSKKKKRTCGINFFSRWAAKFLRWKYSFFFLNNLLQQSYTQAHLLTCVAKTQNAF